MSDGEHLYLLDIPWPAVSPDLKVQDFVLWGYLKECAGRNSAHTHTRTHAHARTHARTHTGAEWNCDNKSRCAKFLCALAELRKANISFAMSVRLSVRTEKLRSHWMIFHSIWYLSIFRKSVEKKSSFGKILQEKRVFYMKSNRHVIISRSDLLRMKSISH